MDKRKVKSGIGKRRAAAKADGGAGYRLRRKEVAQAAARVFDRYGFQGTTISAVANELNLDRASVYYYISGKQDLFDEVIREASEENIATVKRIQESGASPREKLRKLSRELMASYGKHYPLLYVFIRENLRQVADKRSKWAQRMKQLSRDYDTAVIAIIEEGYADGSFRYIGPARVVAFGIIGMLGWTNRWFRPEHSELDARTIGDIYADLAIAGLCSPGTLKVQTSSPAKADDQSEALESAT